MWTESILHVDMDSFYVEVERLDDGSLVGQPVAVGGAGPRGVIASASYEARRDGVRSAQPTSTALRRCTNLVVIPPRHTRYAEVSRSVFAIFRSFSPMVEGLSLDEAFLDVAGLRRHYESPTAVGEAVRRTIRVSLGLPASVGVAATKFVAKLASDAAKPDGLLHVPKDRERDFLDALPAKALWGVGPATLASLERLGVESVGEIAEMPRHALTSALGPSLGAHLHDLANGLDPRAVVPDTEAKSLSVEQTYDTDLYAVEVIESALLAHAHRLSARLRRSGLAARTVNLKLRFSDFTTVTRSQTYSAAIDGSRDLFRAGVALLRQVDIAGPVRLVGLGGSGLEQASGPRQMDLESSIEWDRVERAMASVRERFGEDAITPARLVKRQVTDMSQEPDQL